MSEKPNRLEGLLQPPVETEQELLPPQRMGMGVKSLTLRLPEDEYQRLRLYAFKNNTTHQECWHSRSRPS